LFESGPADVDVFACWHSHRKIIISRIIFWYNHMRNKENI